MAPARGNWAGRPTGERWTPFFGPRTAEFKLAFQVLSGLGFVCCSSVSDSLHHESPQRPVRSEPIAPSGAMGERRTGR